MGIAFAIAMVLSAMALIAYAVHGPYDFLFGVHAPMNAESIFAAAAMVLVVVQWGRSPGLEAAPRSPSSITRRLLPAVGIIAIVTAAFWRALFFPLIYDDYAHISNIVHAPPDFLRNIFTVPAGDQFFRPLGLIVYRLDMHWWSGLSEVRWHIGNLVLHLVCCLLVYVLARRLELGCWTATIAALIFGVHGSRPESVSWLAARFDLLATMFLLATLVLVLRYQEKQRWFVYAAALVTSLAALLSKEAAYILPILLTLLTGRRSFSREGLRLLSPFYILTGLVFLYRWRLLGGIGGYQQQGAPTIFTFSLVRSAKALFLRLWATLWFPINWSTPPGVVLIGLLIVMLAAVIWLCLRHREARRAWWAVAFTLVCALPVQHLLLIGPDLEKSRVLYLPSVGFALLVGFALESLASERARCVIGTALVAFNFTVLWHNHDIWQRVTAIDWHICQSVAAELKKDDRPLALTGVPKMLDGVYFIGNGLPSCVEVWFHAPRERLHINETAPDSAKIYRWDAQSQSLVPVQ